MTLIDSPTDSPTAPLEPVRKRRKRKGSRLMGRRYDIAPVIEIARARWRPPDEQSALSSGPVRFVSSVIGVSDNTVRRWIDTGTVSARTADDIAAKLGLHPCHVWPDWFDDSAIEEAWAHPV